MNIGRRSLDFVGLYTLWHDHWKSKRCPAECLPFDKTPQVRMTISYRWPCVTEIRLQAILLEPTSRGATPAVSRRGTGLWSPMIRHAASDRLSHSTPPLDHDLLNSGAIGTTVGDRSSRFDLVKSFIELPTDSEATAATYSRCQLF